MTMVERARKLYEEKGAPMIREKFPAYEGRIAVGLAGEGSDCFGYDDAISRDHDYGIGFCLWLTEGDYARIGDELNAAYGRLIAEAAAEEPDAFPAGCHPRLSGRRGARSIRSYYESILRIPVREEAFRLAEADWFALPDDAFAAATNGEVFRDDLGVFTAVRGTLLGYYPEAVWRRKLVHELRMFSQYGQSNYARAMARGDALTAGLCKAYAAESGLKLMFLLNRRYAPYYKWLRKAAGGLSRLAPLCAELDAAVSAPVQSGAWASYAYDPTRVNTADAVEACFERFAAGIARELTAQGLIDGRYASVTFLELLAGRIAADGETPRPPDTESLIAELVRREWRQFDGVRNEGGRALCQDDWHTFEIMRSSQFRAWDAPLLERYRKDLAEAEERGWNLLTEKYARMMESTAPEEYARLADRLPRRSAKRRAQQEEVVAIHVGWNEAMAAEYPLYSGGGRPIHTAEDTPWETSSETYLRGELGTYSDETFALYRSMILRMREQGENLVERIAGNQVRQYGYDSLADAEAHLAKRGG